MQSRHLSSHRILLAASASGLAAAVAGNLRAHLPATVPPSTATNSVRDTGKRGKLTKAEKKAAKRQRTRTRTEGRTA